MMTLLLLVQETGYQDGFYVKSDKVRLSIEGLLQVNGHFFEPGSLHDSEVFLRRIRLEFTGEFFEHWILHVEPKFGTDGVELEEAWVGARFGDHRFLLGRMKEPFSLEEMGSQRHMDMLNFSILNQFVPAENQGLTVLGEFGLLEYGAGFYGGPDERGFAARLALHPWRGLQFGAAVTAGRQDREPGELRTEARVPVAEFLEDREGDILRWGVEVAFLEGPFAVTAELVGVREEADGSTVHLTGGYVQASWVITGEDKTWKGVKPDSPFLEEPGVGAWQIVARWSRVDFERTSRVRLAPFPDTIDSFTVGLNWYANDFVKLKVNVLRSVYGRELETEDVLMIQIQLMF